MVSAYAHAQPAPNPCDGGLDETAAIQAAVTAGSPVNFEPRLYCVRATTGVRIPSDRTLKGNGATVGILPGCTNNCKAFETVPGSSNVRLENMTIIGDLTPAPGFSIGFRGDSVSGLELDGVIFRSWRFDGVWLGGNLGTHDARLYRVTVEDFGRNGLSIVNGSGFTVDHFTGRRSNPGALVGAAVDVEGNPGDQVLNVVIMNSLAEDVVTGFYMHSGNGRQGYGWVLINNVVRNASRYGVIWNSNKHGFILNNQVFAPPPVAGQPIPVGISVGVTINAGQPPILAEDTTIAGNYVTGTTRPGILAGVVDTWAIKNTWTGGSLLPVQPAAGIPATAGIQMSVP